MTEKNKKQSIAPEIICFVIFITGVIFISFFHEPWHDELQAWGISKDTIYNILFTVQHYEGHPPLWHLILKIFSSMGLHAELGIRLPNLLFIFAAVYLLIFKSPFPKIIRLSLPFTYFLFYQYSVISRPYSIFCSALFLAAVFYKERNNHPYKYILPLMLLCLSCAYGMVFAAGIIFVWFIEIIRDEKLNFIKNIFKDSRFHAASLTALLCILLAIEIFPAEDVTYAAAPDGKVKVLYTIFGLICDSLCTNISYLINKLQDIKIMHCVLGGFLYIILFSAARSFKVLMLSAVPFIMFLAAAGFLYIYGHHTGLLTVFYIFVFWCALSVNNKPAEIKYKKAFAAVLAAIICIQIYWSIAAYVNEYRYTYWWSRELYKFIKEYNIEKYNTVLCAWEIDNKPEIVNNKKVYKFNYNSQGPAAAAAQYLNKNIFYNFNMLNPDKQYMLMKKMSKEEAQEVTKRLYSAGLPEIIFGNPVILTLVFERSRLEAEYYGFLQSFACRQIWKDKTVYIDTTVYARSDVLEQMKHQSSF